jgi:hypothetical protein
MLRSIVRSGLRYQQRWAALNCAAMSSAAPAPIVKPDIKQTGVRFRKIVYLGSTLITFNSIFNSKSFNFLIVRGLSRAKRVKHEMFLSL